jgi:hypothetical protein
MNKIWCFGDSFTAGDGCRPGEDFYEKYKKEGDKRWPEWITEWTGVNLINKGRSGSSNDMIIDSILLNFDKIKSGDCAIIGKSLSNRYDVPYKDKNGNEVLVPVYANWVENSSTNRNIIESFDKDQLETIINFQYYFSAHKLYAERQDIRFDFIIKRLKEKNVNVFFWEWYKIYTQHETIDQASNYTNLDGHWSFKGNKTFASYLATKFFSNLNGYDINGVDFKNIKTLV